MDVYYGFQVDFERIKATPAELHPGPFAGSFCLILDHHKGTLIKPPAGKTDKPYNQYWQEIVDISTRHILVNV